MPQPPHTYCKALAPEIKVVIPKDPKLKKYHIFQQLENDKQKHALENWQWFEGDRPKLQESISRRINRPQEKLMMDQGFYHRLKLENMGVVESMKKIEDRVRGENIRGRAIQRSHPDDGNRVDNEDDKYTEFNDSDDEGVRFRGPYDSWEGEEERPEKPGPAAVMSKQHLLFCCKPGEIDERTVIVKNKGNTAIFYSWERRPVEPLVLPGRKKEGTHSFKHLHIKACCRRKMSGSRLGKSAYAAGWRLFTVMRGTGSLLPGYQRKFTFKYSSREVGTHLEKWVCRIYPRLKKPVEAVDLKGVTMFDDRFRKWRTSFTRALEYREMMTGVREALVDILCTAGKKCLPPEELRNQEYLYTKDAFDFIRNNLALNPPVFFAPTVFKELEKLAKAVSAAVPKEPDPPPVEIVVEEETDRSRRKSKKEKKKKKGRKGSTADEQEGETPEKSKKTKRKKSKSDDAASSQAEGETDAEDSGKKSRKKSSKGLAEGESEPSADKESRRKSRRKSSKRKSGAATSSLGENESQGGMAASPPQPEGTVPDGSSPSIELSPAAWAGSVTSILEGIRSLPERQHRRHFKKQLNALLETANVPNHQTSLLLMAMYKSLHQISGDVENILETITEETGRPIVEQLLQKYYAQIEAEQAAAESVQGSEPAEDPDDMTWPFKDDDSETDWLPEEEKNQVKRERANDMLAFIMKWIHILTEARCILRYGFDECQDRISDEQASVAAMIDQKISEYSQKSSEDDCWKVFDFERKKQHLEEEFVTLPSCQLPNCPNCPKPEDPKVKDPEDDSALFLPRRGLSILD